MKEKKSISNLDLYVLTQEINDILAEGFVHNVYELEDKNKLKIRFRSKTGKQDLIVDPKTRVSLTNYDYPVPPFPSQFIMALRKKINKLRVKRVYQYNMDRILIIELQNAEGNLVNFIIELFGNGNYVLTDPAGLVFIAKTYRQMKDRIIQPKRPYEFPPTKGLDYLNLNWDEYLNVFNQAQAEDVGKTDAVRFISMNFNIGGYIAEEICTIANVHKNKPLQEIDDEEKKRIFDAFNEFAGKVKSKKFTPSIIMDEKDNYISFEPFQFKMFEQEQIKYKELKTYNEVIDEFFSKIDSDRIYSEDIKTQKKQLTKIEKIYNSQKEKIEESIEIRQKSIDSGQILYEHFTELDTLINTINSAKREKKLEWDEIQARLLQGKEKGILECKYFDRILPKEQAVVVNIEGNEFKLDLTLPFAESVNKIFNKAKVAKSKMQGAMEALKKTEKQLKEEQEQTELVLSNRVTLVKDPRPRWYQKFRHFISSEGFLVLSGRDASSNEVLVKKHMGANDIFLHTDMPGSPVTIIKNPDNVKIPERTIREAGSFTASYSRGWKNGWGNTDIFWVEPDQVSKTPKSGEYVPKGSFIITGKKNHISRPYMELAIGLLLEDIVDVEQMEEAVEDKEFDFFYQPGVTSATGFIRAETGADDEDPAEVEDLTTEASNDISLGDSKTDESLGEEEEADLKDNEEIVELGKEITEELDKNTAYDDFSEKEERIYYPRLIAGPPNVIKAVTPFHVKIKPARGGITVGKLAKKIRETIIKKIDDPLIKKWAALMSLNDLIRSLPAGSSEMSH